MDTSFILSVISRWAHVGTAIVLVGGTAFYRLAVIPALEGDSTGLVERIRNRWKRGCAHGNSDLSGQRFLQLLHHDSEA